jgi:hypothetical protein
VQWYSFNATSGMFYYAALSDSGGGSISGKTCDIKVTAYNSAGLILFYKADSPVFSHAIRYNQADYHTLPRKFAKNIADA